MCARKMSAIRLFLRILDGTHGAGCGREPIVKLLGALIAGGQSRRFGSDKALAVIEGKPLLNHVIDALRSEEHTAELQSLMLKSYAVFFFKKKIKPPSH